MTTAEVVEQTDTIELPTMPADAGEHYAKCHHCPVGVRYRPFASGAGFTVAMALNTETDTTFGIGENGRPVCPNGHGEMELADEQLVPVAEAFERVNEQLADGPVQRSLPGIAPAFNYQGAYLKMEELILRRQRDKKYEDEKHEQYKLAKKDRENTDELINKIGLETHRWRLEKAEKGESGNPGITKSVNRCRFEVLHPGVPCSMSHEGLSADILASEAHGCEALEILEAREIAQCVQECAAIGVIVTPELLAALSIDFLSELQAWSRDAIDNPEKKDELLANLPRALGRPHVAGPVETNTDGTQQYQICAECGGSFTCEEPYAEGTLVGTDCQGKALEHGNRYPEKGKKKAKRRERTTGE